MQIDNNKNNSFYISEPNENEKTSKGLINFDSKLYLILFFFLSFYLSSSSCIGFLSNKITNIIIFLLLTQLSISFLFIFNIVVTFICYLEKFLRPFLSHTLASHPGCRFYSLVRYCCPTQAFLLFPPVLKTH